MYGLSSDVLERVRARQGRLHPFASLRGESCALLIVDMQNYFVKPGFQAEVPAAREIVPAINYAANSVRTHGGTVVWIRTASDGAEKTWSWLHDSLYTEERSKRRLLELAEGSEGFALWPELRVFQNDWHVIKRRFSAFIQGSSDLEERLRGQGIDTVIVAGTATNVCCSSTAQDAMMLNFKTAMLADANAALTTELHVETLRNFMLFFGDVMNVDELHRLLLAGKSERK